MKVRVSEPNSRSFEFITDNSKECGADTAFLITPLSVKYIDDAKAHGAAELIAANELTTLLNISDIKIIGITGTNGKTTTAAAMYSILLDLGFGCALQGTRGFFINDKEVRHKSLTTPMQLEIYDNILKAKEAGCDYFVMEVSSHAIAQKRIQGIEFALRLHTNITQDHLDFHGSFEEYRRVKNSFFASSGLKLVNIDDDEVEFDKTNANTYGIEQNADFKVSAYSLSDGIKAVVEHKDEKASFCSNLNGHFNVYNLLAAVAAVKLATDKSLEEICDAVEHFGGVAGRMEVVSSEPLVIVDFAHTPDGIAKVLDALRHKDIIAVFGAGGDRDKAKRPLMGLEASRRAKKIIITSDNPRSEKAEDIANDILEGISEKSKAEVILDRKEAIKKALQLQQNEAVVLLGKGDEEYQIVGNEKIPFDDRAVARELLGKSYT